MTKDGEKFEMQPLVGTPLDYSDKENWMRFDYTTSGEKQKVDVFYLYPTSVDPNTPTLVSEVNDAMKKASLFSYLKGPETFSSFANIYAPYYRQLSVKGIMQDPTSDGLVKSVKDSVVRTDAYAALDYFFENCNEGRPFILASHSQGSATMKNVLSEYMRMPEHKKYMDRMVAAYTLGYGFTSKWLKDNDLKFATGETDTGVILTWNCFAGEIVESILIVKDGNGINPLNWTVDGTPADKSLCLGSKVFNMATMESRIVPGQISATQDMTYKGALHIKTEDDKTFQPIPDNPLFGKGSYHFDDWSFFYVNIAENAKKRIDAFFKQ